MSTIRHLPTRVSGPDPINATRWNDCPVMPSPKAPTCCPHYLAEVFKQPVCAEKVGPANDYLTNHAVQNDILREMLVLDDRQQDTCGDGALEFLRKGESTCHARIAPEAACKIRDAM